MSDTAGVGPTGRAPHSGAPALRVAAGLALLTIVLRLPAFLAARHLVFDDGVYGVSVVDMRHGLAPYTGVFSAQGPLHFPLLYLGDLLGLRTIDAPRVTPMLGAVLATVAAWAIARRIANPRAGLVAGLLVATSGTMIWTGGQITGDGPAAALALAAVWAALVYRDDPRAKRALVTGLLMGAALAVKPLVLPAALPVGWWLWSHRRLDHLASAIGAAVALWFAAALPWGLGNVWRQSVLYNSGAGPRYAKLGQLRKLLSTLGSRDVLVLATLIVVLVASCIVALVPEGRLRPVARRDASASDVIAVAVWAGATALLLVLEPAMYRNHLAAIVPPLAILGALLVRSPRVLAIVLIVLAPWSVHNLRSILAPTGYRGDDAALVHALQALPAGSHVISDDPGFVYRAGLRTPRLMNDTSVKRIDQHLLTTASIEHTLAIDGRACAVVVWSSRFAHDLPGLPAALRREGFAKAHAYRGDRALWLRPPCR